MDAAFPTRRRSLAEQTEGLALFEPAPELTPEERRARELGRLRERAEPIAVVFALRRGGEGITASELIPELVDRGVLTGQESHFEPRAYAWIGPFLAGLAGLARRGALAPRLIHGIHVRRASERRDSHRNENRVYLHPDVAHE